MRLMVKLSKRCYGFALKDIYPGNKKYIKPIKLRNS